MKKVQALVLIVVILLSSCSQDSKPAQYDILEDASVISTPFAQAYASGKTLEQGLALQTASKQHVYTLPTEDFYGQPFTLIHFLSPQPFRGKSLGSLFAAGARLEKKWDSNDFESPWSTVLTGASDIRDTLISVSPGLELLMDMSVTAKRVGFGRVDGVVAIDSQTFLLRDRRGDLWSISENRKLSEEEVTQLKGIYDAVLEANNSPRVAAEQRESWQALEQEFAAKADALNINFDALTTDGNLDLRANYAALANLTPATENPNGRDCGWFSCHTVYSGYMKSGHQATQGGFVQYKSDYFGGSDKYFKLPACTTQANSKSFLGCGPSAFIGLLGRKFNEGYTFENKWNKKKHTLDNFERHLVRVDQNGRPSMGKYLGTCKVPFSNEAMTTGLDFKAGSKKYLNDAKVPLKLVANVSHGIGNKWAGRAKKNIIIENVGKENNPVVAEYFTGIFSGHFAAIERYRIVDGTVTVTTNNHSKYYSLTDAWGTERGVFSVVKK